MNKGKIKKSCRGLGMSLVAKCLPNMTRHLSQQKTKTSKKKLEKGIPDTGN
jgi:hypothetical protein